MHSFEIHAHAGPSTAVEPPMTPDVWDIDHLFEGESAAHETRVLSICEGDGWVGMGIDSVSGQLRRVTNRAAALAEFKVVPRRVSAGLVMLPLGRDILINGEPVEDMRVLSVRDSLTLAPGGPLAYVTSRFAPYIGPPTEEMLSKKLKCPMCRLLLEKSTQVLTCACGCVMHYETAESHPHETEENRLSCAAKKLANCLSCGRPLTLEPTLMWDPSEMEVQEL